MAVTNLYDVVVVGAGSAGCALAHRLSADPAVSVALVEAGGSDERASIRVPNRYFSNWDTDVDWRHVSTPQSGTADRIHKLPRGRVLGGTSSINGMVYLRGAASDYDRWAASGCVGWDWPSVRSAFEALEECLRPAVLDPLNELSQAMVEAGAQAGFPSRPTFDDGTLEGVGWNRSTIVAGERMSAYQAFVASIRQRPSFTRSRAAGSMARTNATLTSRPSCVGRRQTSRARNASQNVVYYQLVVVKYSEIMIDWKIGWRLLASTRSRPVVAPPAGAIRRKQETRRDGCSGARRGGVQTCGLQGPPGPGRPNNRHVTCHQSGRRFDGPAVHAEVVHPLRRRGPA